MPCPNGLGHFALTKPNGYFKNSINISNSNVLNMKQLLILTFAAFAAANLSAQVIQEIATGAGYQKQSFVSLSAGTEKQVTANTWDIAFTVYGQQDAGVFVNESAGTSMGQPQAAIEVYDALTDNFADQPDPGSLTAFRLFNSEKGWFYGAFNEVRDPANQLDYGWGQYSPPTNQVVGSAVYILKLRNGQFKKIKIMSLAGSTYTFKYANLDGTDEQTKTVNKADHAGKTLAYFSLTTGATADVEPATGGFDLLYSRYNTPLYDPGSMGFIPYNVTGILHGRGSKVAEADGVNPATVQYADWKDSLRSELDVIGYDWKEFSGTGWTMDVDRVFFLKTANNRVWKLQFIDFEGSTTGKSILEKTDLGIISAVQEPAALGMEVLAYPNPVADQLHVTLDIPAELAQHGRLQVTDMQGRVVLNQSVTLHTGFQVLGLDAHTWAAGTYALNLQLPAQRVHLGKISKF
jgi:hypothetical protein